MTTIKKTCFLITSLEPGGTERYLLRFLNRFHNEINAIIICKSGKKGILEKQYKETNAVIITISPGYLNPISWFRTYNVFRKHKIETVCDFTGNFSGIYLLIAKLAGIKKRIAFYRRSSHAFKQTKFTICYDRFVNNLVYKFATNVLANSNFGLNFFHPYREQNDNRFKVIPNGIDCVSFISGVTKKEIREELGIPKNAFVIGHTGRLNVAKNHITILKIAEKIVEKYNNIYILFCGKDTEDLMDQTNSKLLKKRLVLLGYRTDVNRILKAIDLYIFPSITEGQPNALVEAMVSGLPSLASNIEPIKEVFPAELHENLFPPMDIASFIDKIENLYKNPLLLEKMRCKEFASNKFNAENNFDKLFQLL